jgi:hypothetical protein
VFSPIEIRLCADRLEAVFTGVIERFGSVAHAPLRCCRPSSARDRSFHLCIHAVLDLRDSCLYAKACLPCFVFILQTPELPRTPHVS